MASVPGCCRTLIVNIDIMLGSLNTVTCVECWWRSHNLARMWTSLKSNICGARMLLSFPNSLEMLLDNARSGSDSGNDLDVNSLQTRRHDLVEGSVTTSTDCPLGLTLHSLETGVDSSVHLALASALRTHSGRFGKHCCADIRTSDFWYVSVCIVLSKAHYFLASS